MIIIMIIVIMIMIIMIAINIDTRSNNHDLSSDNANATIYVIHYDRLPAPAPRAPWGAACGGSPRRTIL